MTITIGGNASTPEQRRIVREQLGTPSAGNTLSSVNGFDAQVAGMKLVHDIRFGTAATGGTLQIKNLADLAANFLYHQQPNPAGFPYVTHGGYYEYRKFDDPQAGSTYVFGANDLTLQPTSDQDLSATQVTEMQAGSTISNLTAEPIAKFGLASTAGLWVGRVALFAYVGAGRVEAFDATTVTIRMLASGFSGNIRGGNPGIIIWTTATALAVSEAAGTGSVSLTFASPPPAAVQAGMLVNVVGSDGVPSRSLMGGTHSGAPSGFTVPVTAPGLQSAAGSGQYVVFIPRMWTGQLVTQLLVPEPGIGEAWGIEVDATWSDNGAGVMPKTQYMDTLAAFNAAGGMAICMATWASDWLYEAHDSSQFPVDDDGQAEIDEMEVWGGLFHGPANLSSAYHALGVRLRNSSGVEEWLEFAEGYPTAVRANGTWRGYSVVGGASGKSIVGVHMEKLIGTQSSTFKRQLMWERERANIFMDGDLQTRWRGQWASRRAARQIVNASLGGMAYAVVNLNYPQSNQGLANCRVKVRGIKIWKL